MIVNILSTNFFIKDKKNNCFEKGQKAKKYPPLSTLHAGIEEGKFFAKIYYYLFFDTHFLNNSLITTCAVV